MGLCFLRDQIPYQFYEISCRKYHCFSIDQKILNKLPVFSPVLKLDANSALFKLIEVDFPVHLWDSLAIGLMLGGQTEQFEGRTNNSKLQKLITYWIDNDEQASWQQLVDAVNGCDQLVKAKQLAEKVGANPPTSAGEYSLAITQLLQEMYHCSENEVIVEDKLSSPPIKKRKSKNCR